ncbi:hypothetical protein, partial [Ralstonia pseudosolanacearum]
RIRSAVSSNSGGSCRSGANLNWALLEALWPCYRGQVMATRRAPRFKIERISTSVVVEIHSTLNFVRSTLNSLWLPLGIASENPFFFNDLCLDY